MGGRQPGQPALPRLDTERPHSRKPLGSWQTQMVNHPRWKPPGLPSGASSQLLSSKRPHTVRMVKFTTTYLPMRATPKSQNVKLAVRNNLHHVPSEGRATGRWKGKAGRRVRSSGFIGNSATKLQLNPHLGPPAPILPLLFIKGRVT